MINDFINKNSIFWGNCGSVTTEFGGMKGIPGEEREEGFRDPDGGARLCGVDPILPSAGRQWGQETDVARAHDVT